MSMDASRPLIPRRDLFSDPDRTMVRLSPDGRHIAWLAPLDGVRNVWMAPADAPQDARPLTRLSGRGVSGWIAWAYDSAHLICSIDADGDENWVLWSIDTATGGRLALSPSGATAEYTAASPRHPHHIVVHHNGRDPQWYDAYRVDVRTGEARLLVRGDGLGAIHSDLDLTPRSALAPTPDGGRNLLVRDGDGWRTVAHLDVEDALYFQILGFAADGRFCYALDTRGRDTAALVTLDAGTGTTTAVLAADADADLVEALLDPVGGAPLAWWSDPGRRRYGFLDPAVEADHRWVEERLDGALDVTLDVTSVSTDLTRWLVFATRDDGKGAYWLFDRNDRSLRLLFPQRAALQGHRLTAMRVERIAARDGLEMVAYLALPAGTAQRADGRPAAPLPLVLHVHGGPSDRNVWGFHPEMQWLADRGYAVLAVNYRGSTGFGKAFVRKHFGQWGAAMHDDLIDAVGWAIREGIADPARVAIMGASYGGYAALTGLTLTPEVFACAVDQVGPSNLVTLLETIPPYWESFRSMLVAHVGGDPATEEGRAFLWSRSPLSRVDAIRRPLLIAQGANDARVKRAESDRIFTAMRERGLPATYLLFPDEGHWLSRPENRLAFYAVAEQFLARHLGGRAEPIGDAFAGSSVEVVEGSEAPGMEQGHG